MYKNSVDDANLVYVRDYFELFHWPIQVLSTNYTAGTKFIIRVQYTWDSNPGNDYTLKVYSKQDLTILDSNGNSNMWHMDGQYPSAFTKSHYRTDTTTTTPEWTPVSLHEIWLVSNNVNQFFNLLFNNPITMIVWWNWMAP